MNSSVQPLSRFRWPICWLLVIAGIGILFACAGKNGTLAAWGIRETVPSFPDTRSITSACATHAAGEDPLAANPRDPFARPFNYPRLWLELSRLGINESHADLIGWLLVCAFFAGMWIFPPADLNWTGVFLLLPAALSPASFLAMERGNNDLLVFLMVAAAITSFTDTFKSTRWLGITAIMTGFALKIYPVFALAICLGEPKRRFMLFASACAAAVFLYLFMIRGDLPLIYHGTPKSSGLSYGMNVLWMKAAEHSHNAGMLARGLSWTAVGTAALLLWAGHRLASAEVRRRFPESKSMAAFRAGAAIYCGTFVLGNNWDYRLVFLIFTLPLLSTLMRGGISWLRFLSIGLVACILISMWFISIHQAFSPLPSGSAASVLLDECANWLVFLGLSFIFGCRLPDWLPSRSDRC